MGGRFRPRRQFLPGAGHGPGFSDRARILGQSQSRLSFNGWGFDSLAGPGDSILA